MPLPRPVGRQVDAVYLPARGHHVILGTAGTGKTVMAVHRAAHLADPDTENSGPVLLLTFNKSLMQYLRHIAAEYRDKFRIENYHRFARGYLNSVGMMPYDGIVRPGQRTRLIQKAIGDVRKTFTPTSAWFFDQHDDFFNDELDWIDGHGLVNLDSYLGVERVGRTAPLRSDQRHALWQIRQKYFQYRAEAGLTYDWSSLPLAVSQALSSDARARMYRHVVVDEAQDLSPEAIRSLANAVPQGGSVTIFADYAQQIYGQRVSWRSCGLTVRRVEEFIDNYRNTAAIAGLAIAMSQMPHFRDSTDLIAPIAPAAAGARPTLVKCADANAEIALIRPLAQAAGRVSRAAILARTWDEARAVAGGLTNVRSLQTFNSWDDEPSIYIGTYHSAKGLEFGSVYLPFCSAARLPDPSAVAAFGRTQAMSREARLVYVAVTRAQTDLVVTYSGDLAAIFPPADSSLWTVP